GWPTGRDHAGPFLPRVIAGSTAPLRAGRARVGPVVPGRTRRCRAAARGLRVVSVGARAMAALGVQVLRRGGLDVDGDVGRLPDARLDGHSDLTCNLGRRFHRRRWIDLDVEIGPGDAVAPAGAHGVHPRTPATDRALRAMSSGATLVASAKAPEDSRMI